ncbi:Phosphatase YwpJ [Thalassocella blandensis]|nr:Phosphatase YwpJ [Thalassocella blandensis]
MQIATNTKELQRVTDTELPGNDIKAIFFDIDGTLLSLDGSYSAESKQAIHSAKQRGIATGIASGRPYFAAQFVAQELGLNDPGVLCAGAHIMHPQKGETLFCEPIESATSLNLIEALRALKVHYEVYTDSAYFIEHDVIPEIREVHAAHLRVQPLQNNFDDLVKTSNIIKFLAAVPSFDLHGVLHRLERDFPELIFSYANIAAYPQWLFVSMTSKQATREQAFDKLLQWHNIAAENVMSFGDAQSDCVFLQKAGIGIAMGNANDEVKACADFVTLPVWENGVAYALNRFLSR